MKKLMIAAAIVCAAAFAQAASIGWAFSVVDNILNPAGTTAWNGQMTIACVDLGFNQTVQVENGSFSEYFYIDSGEYTPYTFVLTGKDGSYTYSQSKAETGDSFFGGYVMFAGGNAWTKGPDPTPEPTSAMLMLLGVAGLALKRKRA